MKKHLRYTDNASFFDELIDGSQDEAENKVINSKEHKRPIRKKGNRGKLIKSLPHEVVECVLNEKTVCKICSIELEIIEKKKVKSEIEYIPAKLIINNYIQYVYKCIECKKTTNPYDSIYGAAVPVPVLTHSFASPSIVAWIMYQKYMMSIPLYRQEKDFKRMGAELKKDMMSNWMIRSSKYWLKPIYHEIPWKESHGVFASVI